MRRVDLSRILLGGTTLACKLDKCKSWTNTPRDAATRDRCHELPMMVRLAAHALEYLHIHPTTPNDLQKSFWLTMMRRRLRVSQESPES